MSQPSGKPAHPGAFIREGVIPSGMSVTEAAKRLGVGRPALSNLLNGKSSLSPDMAAKLEKAFGADGRKLLDHQAAFDRNHRSGDARAIAVRAYVPGFLTIEARQIHGWAEGNLDARRLLPVLLRKLVHSTGGDLRQVDFPGYDNAERRGWDGWIEVGAATPWVPEGKSGWEFSTNQAPPGKAEHDYRARLKSISPTERAECTFVFVTPRNWPGKSEWAKDKRATGDWKDVRAFDASDLEQWLEQSIPAQIWLAEQIGMPIEGFETLDRCWRRWAEASDPQMTPAMFQSSITAHRDTFSKWLERPSERPFVVAADSRDEALAFLACLFRDDGIAARWRELAAVFESPEALRKLAASRRRSSRSSIPTRLNASWPPSTASGIASPFAPAMLSIPIPTSRSTCSTTALSKKPLPVWTSRATKSIGWRGNRVARRRSCGGDFRMSPRSGYPNGPGTGGSREG